MAHFRVKFFKDVMNDTGQDFDACQPSFDVDAKDEEQAVTLAKAAFLRRAEDQGVDRQCRSP
jgi:1,2-phenylacetyl-CoA epoxidase PaaB subunit